MAIADFEVKFSKMIEEVFGAADLFA